MDLTPSTSRQKHFNKIFLFLCQVPVFLYNLGLKIKAMIETT